MQFNEEQRQAISSTKPFILVSAGAGSGKTRILTERFVGLCERRLLDPDDPAGAGVEEIVAITFTDKAAREMKDRIRQRLLEKEAGAESEEARRFWQEQKEALERAYISTFHSFCQRLLSQYAMTAKLIPATRVLDEVEARRKKRAIAKEMLEEPICFQQAAPLLELMSKTQLIETIEQLHDTIRELVVDERAIETLDPASMLKLQEEQLLLEQHRLVSAFHEQALACIRSFPDPVELTKAQQAHVERIAAAFATIMPPKEGEAHAYFAKLEAIMPPKIDKRWLEKAPALYQLCAEHWKPLKESWKSIGIGARYEQETVTCMEAVVGLLQQFAARYAWEKERAGLLDFNDLQQKAVALLRHPAIRSACQKQFRHMMIDEFQDTNQLQLAMLEQINPAYQFIVGDQKQSIYRFRGANVILMNEKEAFAGTEESAEAILMNTNYRTEASIIQAVNGLFSHVMTEKRVHPFETVYAPLRVVRRREEEKPCVELATLPEKDEREEDAFSLLAGRLASMIRTGEPLVQKGDEWVRPTWADVAVLIPARTQLLALERALHDHGIPYVVSGGIGFFERQEIIDFITLLRWLNRPFEEVHLLALLRGPLCGLTLAELFEVKRGLQDTEALFELVYDETHPFHADLSERVSASFAQLREWLKRWVPLAVQHSPATVLTELFQQTGLKAMLLLQKQGLQKVRNVEKLIGLLAERRALDLETMLAELEEVIVLSEKEGEAEVEQVEGNVVQIMTVHASKGLEFPIVFLPQLERTTQTDKGRIRFDPELGIVLNLEKEADQLDEKPICYQSPGFPLVKERAALEAKEETKRLLYVAMTRARDYLVMMGEATTSHSWMTMIEEACAATDLEQIIQRVTEFERPEKEPERAELQYAPPQLVQRAAPSLTLTVSEIMSFCRDPLNYFYRFVVGLPESLTFEADEQEERSKATGLDSSKLGTLIHRACELRDYGFSPAAAMEEALAGEEVDDERAYMAAMKRLLMNYSEEQRRQLGSPVANEWRFATEMEGVEVIGEIDKIVEREGRHEIIDFKTNRIQSSGGELLTVYRDQLTLYKIAYEQQTGMKDVAVSLYVLRDARQPLHQLNVTKEQENRIRRAIQLLRSLREKKAGKEEYQRIQLQT
ncbi:UvrD-helicase domain-containing protein [Halalkalibacter oceani]|uniref:DNA 3'-5' helicase n=1 Tax=Halalkalibacter oceani TaxID=1653776 RepID=A0A9X2DTD6_9BACI|nr:UvrD-helicase domain-containing protein [Halalkalibacter oceani]MCM3715135.1 UvrD-helicase domain-containing protein [Halalkalibacter oceani]